MRVFGGPRRGLSAGPVVTTLASGFIGGTNPGVDISFSESFIVFTAVTATDLSQLILTAITPPDGCMVTVGLGLAFGMTDILGPTSIATTIENLAYLLSPGEELWMTVETTRETFIAGGQSAYTLTGIVY